MGSPKWTDPKYMIGSPMDWHTTITVPHEPLKAALSQDSNLVNQEAQLFLSSGPRCHLELLVHYFGLPMDGSVITTYALNYLPTSRGTITLASLDPVDKPLMDNNHYATEADLFCIRTAIRTIFKLINTEAMKEMVVEEVVAGDDKPIHEKSTDSEINARMCKGVSTLQHPIGTASIGKVVDTQLRVIGVKGLRVVDASVIPTPITSPIQACVVYALGEQAVDLILSRS